MKNTKSDKKYDSSEINKETYKILFDNEIEYFDTSEKDEILDSIISFRNVEFNEKTLQYKYRKDNNVISFFKLSDFVDISRIEDILKTTQKSRKCHIGSIGISISLKKKNRILTGYYKRNNRKGLHSVVEIEDEKGQLCIMDYTMNIIMLKEQYFDLTQFEEIETITNCEFKEDINMVSQVAKEFSIKAYLTFRKEIMKDLKKNEKIFEDDER